MTKTAKLVLEEKTIELPVFEGSCNEKAVDISSLRSETGYITLDPAYVNTGSCTSSITYIDGEQGILRYRGIPIEDLAEKANFLEVSYLLIHGKLPNQKELDTFCSDINYRMGLHENTRSFYDGFPRDAHPMAILASVVCSLGTYYQEEEGSAEEVSYLNSIRILAKMPTIIAWAYKKSVGHPFVYPRVEREYCENFMHMMFERPIMDYDVDPDVLEILNMLLILHADHEQNCSTSVVRAVRSSMANMYACIASGVLALWGARHGGANQRVIEMLEQIRENGGDVKAFMQKVKDKDSGVRLMGFGHRVYKNYDPRARIIKEKCNNLLQKSKRSDELLDIAQELEETALKDDYFVERKLYPNVDFYSGIIYREMGIPINAFTSMFALGRVPGWIAQAKEFLDEPNNRISRPRQIYTGPALEEFVPIESRK